MAEHTEQQQAADTDWEVTQVQASWTEQERGGPGAFTVQLILDRGGGMSSAQLRMTPMCYSAITSVMRPSTWDVRCYVQ